MGNRAVITTAPYKPGNVGIYLHWNGGRASIEGFLKACESLGYREPPDDYGIARLAQVIGTYFADGLSVGVGLCKDLDTDNGDNGTYLIDGWEIVGRMFANDREEVDPTKTAQICQELVFKIRAMNKVEYVAA